MKRISIVLTALCIAAALYSLDFQNADDLHEKGDYGTEFDLLQNMLYDSSNNSEKAEVFWRMARARLELTELVERDGGSKEEILDGFQSGVNLAEDAIKEDSSNYLAYFWHSANLGRWGQTKGILDSLDKAKPMRDDLEKAINANPGHSASWRVLGMLYCQVPGIISFGDKDAAVSLGRKSVDTREEADDFENHFELAKILAARDWSASKRNKSLSKKEQKFNKETNLLEKHFYYEGILDFDNTPGYAYMPLKEMSDMEEAKALLEWVDRQLKRLPNKQPGDYQLMDDVKLELDSLNG